MIYKQHEDEALVLNGEAFMAIPFSFAVYPDTEEPEIRVYPSLMPLAEAFFDRFEYAMFSDEAIAWAKKTFGAFLSENGFEVCEESEDYFISYLLKPAESTAVLPTTVRLDGVGALENLTEYDIDTMTSQGHLCFATVMDGMIVSAACTNSPVDEDVEDTYIEIGVETVSDYAGHGYGSSNVAALTAALAKMGAQPLYECASKNAASMALAKKLGGEIYAKNYYLVGVTAD